MSRWAVVLIAFLTAELLDSAQLTVVRGRVVAQDDGSFPMRGARVVLVGTSATADPIFTDRDGRFALGVPLSFTLKITKAGYAPAVVSGKGGASGDLVVRMARGAVIVGRVTDEPGFPVVSAGVRARRLDPSPADAAAELIEFTGETDDNGEYRLGSLPPGRYTVHSEPRAPIHDLAHMLISEADVARVVAMARMIRMPTPLSEAVTVTARGGDEVVARLTNRMPAVAPVESGIGGAVSGVVVDSFGEPLEGAIVIAWRVRYVLGRRVAMPAGAIARTDDRGQYRLFHLPPSKYLIGVDDPDGPSATVFHPSAATPANAAAIAVRRSQDSPGAHVVFTRLRQARVAGSARMSNGAPLLGTVLLSASHRSEALPLPRLTMTASDGAYEFNNVPPGEYVLRAAPVGNAQLEEIGVRRVAVAGPEVPPVEIRTSPAATVAGRIVLEGREAPGDDLYFRVVALPDPDYSPPGARGPTISIRDDRTFEIGGLLGPTRFAMTDGPPGWFLKSVDIRGVNAVHDPVTFTGAEDSRRDVVVTVSDAGAAVLGRVDDAGRAVEDYRVVLFSTDRQRWFGGSPYVRMTGGPDAGGGFRMTSVSPGEYFIAAVDVLDGDGASGEWQTAEFLDGLAGAARRITAGERQQVTSDLRLIRRGAP